MIPRTNPTTRAGARRLVGLGLAWLALAPAAAPADDGRAIDWRLDLTLAQREAKARNRPLWIQLTAPWCHYCHKMDRESFTHPRVVAQACRRFIPVRLQADSRLKWENVVAVMDACRKAGFDNVSFAPPPDLMLGAQ